MAPSLTLEVPSLTLDEILDATPLTKTQRKLWLLSAMGVALDGFDFFIIGVALPLIAVQFHTSDAMRGAIAVAAVFGAFLGAAFCGPLADRIGRKTMFTVDLILFVFGAAATALAWNPVSLIVFRFLLGVGIGADYPIGVSYIAENVPSRLRGQLVIGAFAFQAVGSLAGVALGLAMLTADPNVHAWRWMLAFGMIPAIAVVLMRQTLPESARWHLERGEVEKASRAASRLLEKPVELPRSAASPGPHKTTLSTLFTGRCLRRTIFASAPWFLQDISTYGIGIFTPTIMAALALGQSPNFITADIGATQAAAYVDVMLVVGFAIAIIAIRYLSRVTMQIGGFFGMAAGLGMVALSTAYSPSSDLRMPLILSGFMVFNLFMNAGPNSTTYLLSGEVFPTRLRGTGAGFAASAAKLGAVLGTFFFPVLKASIGLPALLLLLAAASLLGAAITYAFRVDTAASLRRADEILSAPAIPALAAT